MEYGWLRQWSRDVTNAPDLADVMTDAKENRGGDSLLDRLIAGVGRVLPNAISAAKGALAQLSYSGTTGNFQTALEFITLSAKFMQIVPQSPEKIGSPLYQSVMINTLNGFVKTERAVFASPIATTTEEEAVEAFMNNGFYYE